MITCVRFCILCVPAGKTVMSMPICTYSLTDAKCTSCSCRNIHQLTFSKIHSGYLQTDNLANSEDPDEMPHTAAFHQGLHCLLR